MTKNERRIDNDPAVRRVAAILGVRSQSNLLKAIQDVSVEQVDRWLRDFKIEPTSLDDVHRLVLNQTGVRVVRVESDAALLDAAEQARELAPAVHVQLAFEFERQTEAMVVKRPPSPRNHSSQFVAFVDARGERSDRAWFAERHEPTHVLIRDPETSSIVRRTRAERPEPLEQVVDAVTSSIGFWEPVVRPVLNEALRTSRTTLDALEQTRMRVAPGASKGASYRSFADMLDHPINILWCDYRSRSNGDRSSHALRAVAVITNTKALALNFRIWPNYRIPRHSIIHEAREERSVFTQQDNLRAWKCESSRPLPPREVLVTARGSWATVESFR